MNELGRKKTNLEGVHSPVENLHFRFGKAQSCLPNLMLLKRSPTPYLTSSYISHKPIISQSTSLRGRPCALFKGLCRSYVENIRGPASMLHVDC